MPRPSPWTARLALALTTAATVTALAATPVAAQTGNTPDDAPASMSPDSMAIANPEKLRVETEDGRIVEPGMRIGADPQLTKALGRIDTAQMDLARLADRMAQSDGAVSASVSDPSNLDDSQYAQEVIGQALLAVESLAHTDQVDDASQALQDTRLALTNARRALADDDLRATAAVENARQALASLEAQLVEGGAAVTEAELPSDDAATPAQTSAD